MFRPCILATDTLNGYILSDLNLPAVPFLGPLSSTIYQTQSRPHASRKKPHADRHSQCPGKSYVVPHYVSLAFAAYSPIATSSFPHATAISVPIQTTSHQGLHGAHYLQFQLNKLAPRDNTVRDY